MTYQSIQNTISKLLKNQKKKASKITLVRLILAIIFLFFLYETIKNGSTAFLTTACLCSFFTFLLFVNFHQKLLVKINYNETILRVCQDEIAAEQGITTQFDGGIEYEEREHAFSFDLDIFGNKSIFQLLNRSFTQNGKNALANQLKSPFLEKNVITSRQKAIQELKNKINWRVNFLVTGRLLDENHEKFKQITAWLSDKKFDLFAKYKLILLLVPIINISIFVLFILDIIDYRIWLATLALQSIISIFNKKTIDETFLKVSRYTPKLEKYIPLFELIEQEKFESEMLKNSLCEPTPISSEIKGLVTISKYFNLRNTMIGGPILNAFFLWDYQCAYRFEIWKKHHSKLLFQAFDTLYEFEALVSIACFANANPDYVVPEISETIALKSTQIGHPLIKKILNVCNDFQIVEQEQFFIVTGANMAGKSTFLRSIGANMVLAMIGSPVYAQQFIFKPIQIFSCMRITDSVGEGESYFHAELGRLSKIVHLLDEEKAVFVILDELLKGTNSKDKLLGSELFLEKLCHYKNAFGMIATHDLALTDMTKKHPKTIKNICFEINIEGEKMTFDYKLKDGITQNMNALFLMKQMGIV
jgi:hypothetical protein